MAIKYIMAVSKDGNDHCLTSKENWDIGGDESMTVTEEFDVASHEEAKILYEAWKDEQQEKLNS